MSARILAQVVFDPAPHADRRALYAAGPIEVTGRRSARVPAGATVSFGSYFNAFPAWHWHRYTDLRAVGLAIRLRGTGTLSIRRTDADGRATEVDRLEVAEVLDIVQIIDLGPNAAGGWLWFDLEGGDGGLELLDASWVTDAVPRESRGATLSMTTMDKPDFALGVLRRLADDPRALDALDEVLVIDQGARTVDAHPGYPEVAAALGGRLRLLHQANVGGSGGFSRGMLEVLDADRSGAVILLDDDVEIEPESIARAVAFAAHTTTPTIVGGHMFDLNRPLVLHAFNERVSVGDFDWGPIGPARHDFGDADLAGSPWLHAPVEPDYNGWWFCLIPTEVIASVGLSLPAFLKWDDAEYGLRAKAAGFPTVSLPGMAVWHITWLDKDDSLGWQAFYHARNRMVAALVDPRAPGRGLPRANLVLDLRYLLSMDYHAVELRHLAYDSVLAGPGGLHAELTTGRSTVVAAVRRFADGEPHALGASERAHETSPGTPRPRRESLEALRDAAVQWVTGTRSVPAEPDGWLSERDAGWWDIARRRHVVVVGSDGVTFRRHLLHPPTFRRMALRAVRDWIRVTRAWRGLAGEYSAAAPALVSADTWRATLGVPARIAADGDDGHAPR